MRAVAERAQRCDVVQDPEPAPVRRDHQIVAVDDQIADRRMRQVQREQLPVVTIVERHIHLALRACIEEAFDFRIGAYNVH